MKSNFIPKLTIAASTYLGSCLFGLTQPAFGADAGTGCSNHTLHGDYGFTIEGTLALPGGTLLNGAGLSLRGVVVRRYDGQGNLSQTDHVVVNGMPPALDWTPGTGTYTVNSDCTGTATINTASNPTGPLNLHFVIDKQGREIREVVDVNAVVSTGERIE